MTDPRPPVPRIESLVVRNYRALKELELKKLSPLTVLVGPNGSGKSTVLDVFAFLAESFELGLRKAWEKRSRFAELRTRGEVGPIEFELQYREAPKTPLITYHLQIEENASGPVVAKEFLRWKRGNNGRPFHFLDFVNGEGTAISGEAPDERDTDKRIHETLSAPDLLAVSALGALSSHPRVTALKQLISGWYVSYLSAECTRTSPEAGPQERLSKTGDNLPNLIQYLREQHPERLDAILGVLKRRVPRLHDVKAEVLRDNRLLLLFQDDAFNEPVLSKYTSDGTLKMLAYLTVLYDPDPPTFVGIEEPENHLHPRLLPELAEECRSASSRTQLIVTTHSPFFLNELRPEEVRVLYRDGRGYTKARALSDVDRVMEMVDAGGKLGHLWMEGFFGVGDPLNRGGEPGARAGSPRNLLEVRDGAEPKPLAASRGKKAAEASSSAPRAAKKGASETGSASGAKKGAPKRGAASGAKKAGSKRRKR